MNRELIIDKTGNQITIALLEDKVLVELNKEQSETGYAVGDIYLGKVKKIMPGLNAAFVNVGHEKDAFIHYQDLGPQFETLKKLSDGILSGGRVPKFSNLKLESIMAREGKTSDFLKTGQSVVVQISKEAISTKGPRITADISMAGRHVVLIPFSNKINISQKIRSTEEKKRLKRIVDKVLPNNYGVIIRTAAMGKSDEDLENDITTLVERWESTLKALKGAQAPTQLLSEMNRAMTIIRDLLNGMFSTIAVNDKGLYDEIKSYIKVIAPEKEKIVKLYKGADPIFEHYDVTRQIKSLFARYVSLKKGAYLIMDHAEAMHVIDVNSGNRSKSAGEDPEQTVMDVNLLAAAEIARQLRLRDLGGIIVIDFIDLHKADNRQQLLEKMQMFMATDRAKHTILPLTKFGLMQITRQRVRPLALEDVKEKCPTCGGSGKIVPSVLLDRQIEDRIAYWAGRKMKFVELRVSPFVEAFLKKGFPSLVTKWKMKYHCKIKVSSGSDMGFVDVKYFDKKGAELL